MGVVIGVVLVYSREMVGFENSRIPEFFISSETFILNFHSLMPRGPG